MTEAADLVLTNGSVHTMTDPDEEAAAVAIRDGEIVRVGSSYEVGFLDGVETEVIDLDGRVVLPGFVDAHTHLEQLGQHLVYADLSEADGREDCLRRLRESAREDREWILGFSYDESEWDDDELLTREDLDRVSVERPVAAVRVDMHTATVNGVALDRLDDELPDGDVRTEDGGPTGVLVEDAVGVLRERFAPDVEETRELIRAARDRAHSLGVTGVHDMVRNSHAPRVYRELDLAGELDLRVRINYWSDHLDSVIDAGLRPDHGSEFVRTGAIKTFTDGAIGGRTAKLSEPYADGEEDGQWVVDPEAFAALVERVDDADLQIAVHAIGDEAIELALSALESLDDPGAIRHRIEHLELADDDAIDRLAAAGVVASVQPNFLRWAGEGGLYDRGLGERRRRESNRFRALLDAGVPLAFGSDCMPLDPLYGVHHAVNAPTDDQRVSVTDALRAYTAGAAYAGFDEDRLGTIEPGTCADLVVLERSPWEHSDAIDDVEVVLTIVDGTVAYDDNRD